MSQIGLFFACCLALSTQAFSNLLTSHRRIQLQMSLSPNSREHGTSSSSIISPLSFGAETVNNLKLTAILGSTVFLSATASFADSIPPSELKPIVVLGSGGKTGKLVVDRLLAKGYRVRPTYREVMKDNPSSNTLVDKPVAADVKSVESLMEAIAGSSVVIFAASASKKGGDAKSVDYLGVENIAKACVQQKIPRLIVISSGAITRPNSIGFKITNLFGRIMEYKLQGENALRDVYKNAANPSLSYAIVRPGGLADGKPSGAAKIELNQGDTISGEINRSDVAECVASAAVSKTLPKDITFEIYEVDKSGPLEGRFTGKSGYERTGSAFEGCYDKMLEGLIPDNSLKQI
eukprot:gene11435-23920_t